VSFSATLCSFAIGLFVLMAALYSDILLDHFRNPRNYGSLPSADATYEEFNPLCGDRIRIELEISDNRIAAARFVGDGCAISIAAASLLTELILNAEIDQGDMISSVETQDFASLLLSSLKSDIKPSRVKCAMLPLEALRSCVKIYKQPQPSR
jgi:nitrogen fixation protein NifU and related proteins